jgi:hypothetical protein
MNVYPGERVTSFVIDRPAHGVELISMDHSKWMDMKAIVFFPDGMDRKCSDYPYSGITVCCKWQGHFVVACGHKESWVLSGISISKIDLEYFGPEWRGCSITVLRA